MTGRVLKLNEPLSYCSKGQVAGDVCLKTSGMDVGLRWSRQVTEREFWTKLSWTNQPEVMSNTKLD